MSTSIFDLSAPVTATVPVTIKVPNSVTPDPKKADKAQEQKFLTRTAYVTFRLPTEDELDEVMRNADRHNEAASKRIGELETKRDEAADDTARQQLDTEIADERRKLRSYQNEQLKAFLVDLPENCGFADGDKPAAYSVEMVERLCQFRPIRTGLWNAFLTFLNGPDSK